MKSHELEISRAIQDKVDVTVVKTRAGRKSSGTWTDALIRDKRGEVRPILANAILCLECDPKWQDVLAFNEFSLKTVARKPTPFGFVGEFTDQQDRLTCEDLQHRGVCVPLAIAGQAIQTVAQKKPFHPVRDWLNDLKWDATPRLDSWLVRYLGVPEDRYALTVGPRVLIGAVARAFEPGCKVDSVPVLEGRQGTGKSSVCRALGGEWFTDELAQMGTKDAAMQVRGAWFIEVAELSALKGSDFERVKAFISRQADRFRPPYGQRVELAPRQCVFIGTTNEEAYLKDATGARRFWPLATTRIDLEGLRRDRDQLFAEAVVAYHDGRAWWFEEGTEEAVKDAERVQEARYVTDPWEELIREYVAMRTDVSIKELNREVLNIPIAQQVKSQSMRVGQIMKRLGFRKRQRRNNDGRIYYYSKETEG